MWHGTKNKLGKHPTDIKRGQHWYRVNSLKYATHPNRCKFVTTTNSGKTIKVVNCNCRYYFWLNTKSLWLCTTHRVRSSFSPLNAPASIVWIGLPRRPLWMRRQRFSEGAFFWAYSSYSYSGLEITEYTEFHWSSKRTHLDLKTEYPWRRRPGNYLARSLRAAA